LLAAEARAGSSEGRVTVDGLAYRRVGHGRSGDGVFRLTAPLAAFVKVAADTRVARHEITREAAALAWLRGTVSPSLIWFGEVEGRLALTTEALPGVPLHEAADPQAGAIAAVRTLAALHTVPVETCPFDERLDVKLAEARRRAE